MHETLSLSFFGWLKVHAQEPSVICNLSLPPPPHSAIKFPHLALVLEPPRHSRRAHGFVQVEPFRGTLPLCPPLLKYIPLASKSELAGFQPKVELLQDITVTEMLTSLKESDRRQFGASANHGKSGKQM